ncbi:uncharacterized protein LOC125863953 [Solanum stenotomum]|uniref:uncharacterized protein LOC125863953 n=1 Tax=Solanum stenotomum TaxID=172797 RepID=UPI0020D0E112|nr:uncharacterized protein LOC125863953 [Solanum stenotomum]
MATPLNFQRGQIPTRPPLFDGPYMPTMEVKDGDVTRVVPKTRQQYNDSNRRKFEKNHKARKLLMCGIGVNEYDLISSCELAKLIWDRLREVYEGTEETMKSKLDLFTTQFESFTIKEVESIHEMRTRFSTITNELMFLEEHVLACKQVSTILEILPRPWTNEFVIGDETRDAEVVMFDALFEHLKVHWKFFLSLKAL